MNSKRKQKGFTLVEVIVVLVILAILAAISIPALTGYIAEAKDRQLIADARNCTVAAQTVASQLYASEKDKGPTSPSGTRRIYQDQIEPYAGELSPKEAVYIEYSISTGKVVLLVYTNDKSRVTVTRDATSDELIFTVKHF